MALFARQDGAGDGSVFLRCAALEVVLGAARKAEVLGCDDIALVPAVTNFAYARRRAEGNFVELVLSVNDHAALDAKAHEHARERLDKVLVVHAEQLHFRRTGVRQRPQDVEHRAEAQLLADGADVFHRAVVFLRKEEAHADLF